MCPSQIGGWHLCVPSCPRGRRLSVVQAPLCGAQAGAHSCTAFQRPRLQQLALRVPAVCAMMTSQPAVVVEAAAARDAGWKDEGVYPAEVVVPGVVCAVADACRRLLLSADGVGGGEGIDVHPMTDRTRVGVPRGTTTTHTTTTKSLTTRRPWHCCCCRS